MVHEVADHRVRDQAGRRHAAVDDLRRNGLLHQALAAAACPLAVDVAVHEELCRHDVQLLADVLAHTHHRLAAHRARAARVLRFMMVFNPAKMIRQWSTTWLALGVRIVLGRRRCFAPGLLQLRLQTGFILGQRLLEETALLGVHRFSLRAELPCLQPCELEGDLLDLGVLEPDLVVLLAQPLKHLLRECGDGLRRQTLQVFIRQIVQCLHV